MTVDKARKGKARIVNMRFGTIGLALQHVVCSLESFTTHKFPHGNNFDKRLFLFPICAFAHGVPASFRLTCSLEFIVCVYPNCCSLCGYMCC